VFGTVVAPQLSGAMWAGTLLVFLYSLSEFGAVQLLRYDTLTRAIYSARLFDRDVSLALSLVLAVVALVVASAERAVARRRAVTEAVGRGRPLQAPLGRWKVPATAFVAAVVGLALVVPVAVLLHWTLRGALGDVALHVDRLPSAAGTSALLGLGTALVAMVAILPLAYLTTRHRSVAGDGASALVVSGFALPGLVVALSLVFFVLHAPLVSGLYQTYGLLVFAYVVHFGSQAMRAGQVAVAGVPRRVEDAARALGAGRPRRLFTVELPLMRGGLAAGAGLVLLSTMKELPATLVLRPLGAETLATRIWASSTEGFYAEAGLAALVLVGVSAALTWVLTIRNLDRVR
jgi:iron(III) transport system permease protein